MNMTDDDFLAHKHGKWFWDLERGNSGIVREVLDFFQAPDRVRRMMESEVHHDRPALYGVVRELLHLPRLQTMELMEDAALRHRRRMAQFFGAVVKVVMEQHGWLPRGHKASLGKNGIIRRGERYMPPKGYPDRGLWVEANPGLEARPPRAKVKRSRKPPVATPQVDETGRTRAQQMRDLIQSGQLSMLMLEANVTKESIQNWLRQARRDDGEHVPVGRGVQPSQRWIEWAHGLRRR